MKATAVSNIKRIIIKGIVNRNNDFLKIVIEESKWIKRCPLIILAARRTERVIGRIKFLTVSIITIKNLNIIGDPNGTRWAIIILNLLIKENKIKVIQKGKAKNIVNTKWLDEVKT